MKSRFIESMISNNKNVDIEKLTYGLDVMYISFTKLIFILFSSILFNCFNLTISCLIFVSLLRSFSYGLHMDNSIKCYIFSFFVFVLFPKLFVYINLSYIQAYFVFMLCFLSFVLYAPSDTNKRPLINYKKRTRLKYISIFILIIYIFSYLNIKDIYFSKIILYSVVAQSILINPITYKLFKLPYENFKEVRK